MVLGTEAVSALGMQEIVLAISRVWDTGSLLFWWARPVRACADPRAPVRVRPWEARPAAGLPASGRALSGEVPAAGPDLLERYREVLGELVVCQHPLVRVEELGGHQQRPGVELRAGRAPAAGDVAGVGLAAEDAHRADESSQRMVSLEHRHAVTEHHLVTVGVRGGPAVIEDRSHTPLQAPAVSSRPPSRSRTRRVPRVRWRLTQVMSTYMSSVHDVNEVAR